MEPQFFTAKEIAARLGMEASTFTKMVAKGDLPQGIEITGKKLKMWPYEDVPGIAWLLKIRGRMRKSSPEETDDDAE